MFSPECHCGDTGDARMAFCCSGLSLLATLFLNGYNSDFMQGIPIASVIAGQKSVAWRARKIVN